MAKYGTGLATKRHETLFTIASESCNERGGEEAYHVMLNYTQRYETHCINQGGGDPSPPPRPGAHPWC